VDEAEEEEEGRAEPPQHQRGRQLPQQDPLQVAAVQRPAGQRGRTDQDEVGESFPRQAVPVVGPEAEQTEDAACRQADRQKHRHLPHPFSRREEDRRGQGKAGQNQVLREEQEQVA
jgi:hypothetical protein